MESRELSFHCLTWGRHRPLTSWSCLATWVTYQAMVFVLLSKGGLSPHRSALEMPDSPPQGFYSSDEPQTSLLERTMDGHQLPESSVPSGHGPVPDCRDALKDQALVCPLGP